MKYIICFMRQQDRVFGTDWTTIRGVEAMDYSYALRALTVWGRQGPWEDSPAGWPQAWRLDDGGNLRNGGRPLAQ